MNARTLYHRFGIEVSGCDGVFEMIEEWILSMERRMWINDILEYLVCMLKILVSNYTSIKEYAIQIENPTNPATKTVQLVVHNS